MGKEEGRVAGLWPGEFDRLFSMPGISTVAVCRTGSCLHSLRALRYPRWEDFNYGQVDKVKNRLYWLGDGSTLNEKSMSGDREWDIVRCSC